jgi:hypothetical protein
VIGCGITISYNYLNSFVLKGRLIYKKINAQTTKLEELNPKKKRKVPINANELFAGIEKIK